MLLSCVCVFPIFFCSVDKKVGKCCFFIDKRYKTASCIAVLGHTTGIILVFFYFGLIKDFVRNICNQKILKKLAL